MIHVAALDSRLSRRLAGPTIPVVVVSTAEPVPAGDAIVIRRLDRSELGRVGEIDRAERIDILHKQTEPGWRNSGDWSAGP